MTQWRRAAVGLVGFGLMGAALAGEADPAAAEPIAQAPAPGLHLRCSRVVQAVVPKVAWKGEASYEALAQVKAGRVVAVEIRSLNGGVERRTQRALIAAVEGAMKAYQCEGDGVFSQRFAFSLTGPSGEAAP